MSILKVYTFSYGFFLIENREWLFDFLQHSMVIATHSTPRASCQRKGHSTVLKESIMNTFLLCVKEIKIEFIPESAVSCALCDI